MHDLKRALACGFLSLGVLSNVHAQTGAITGPSSLPPGANPAGITTPVNPATGGTSAGASSPAGNGVVTPPVTLAPKTFMVPAPPFPANDPLSDPLYQQVSTAIQVTSQRYLTANVHTPWQIFHGILALHESFQLKLGNEKVSAISWIASSNPQFDGKPWILITPNGGKFHPFTRAYAFEGHPSQFLALLSESDLPPTFAFKTPTRDVTITEMLQTSMRDVNDREEITWVLWALVHYYPTTTQWANARNEPWSIERLVQIQNAAAVEKGACGGNHGLFALARARDKHIKEGLPLNGVWFEADYKIKRYTETARSMQNPDGTFSSKFYQGPGYTTDLNSRLNTTGHTLEFLAAALPAERLNEPWVRNAVTVLSKDMIDNRKAPSDCGPLYHSLNALRIYHSRVWPKPVVEPTPESKPGNEAQPPTLLPGITATPSAVPATKPEPDPKALPAKEIKSNSSDKSNTESGPASASSPVIPGAAPVALPPATVPSPAPVPVTPAAPAPMPLKPATTSQNMSAAGNLPVLTDEDLREQQARLRSLNVSGTVARPAMNSGDEPELFNASPSAISILAPASALKLENVLDRSLSSTPPQDDKVLAVPETKDPTSGKVSHSLSTDDNRRGWKIRAVPLDWGSLKPASNQTTLPVQSTSDTTVRAESRNETLPSSGTPPPSRPLTKSSDGT